MVVNRAYDVVVWGVTGFTGKLIAQRIQQHAETKFANIKFAVAGRNKEKIQAFLDDNQIKGLDILTADSNDEASLQELVLQTKCVIACVGPFTKLGEPIVKACVENGTDYVDITGETPWVNDMREKYGQQAIDNKTLIVPCCGYDSIPADMLLFQTLKYLPSERKDLHACFHFGLKPRRKDKSAPGSHISNGTYKTLLGGMLAGDGDRLNNSKYLNPIPYSESKLKTSVRNYSFDGQKTVSLLPLDVIPDVNVLKMSIVQLPQELKCEKMEVDFSVIVQNRLQAYIATAGLKIVPYVFYIPGLYSLANSRMEVGDGPSSEERANSEMHLHCKMELFQGEKAVGDICLKVNTEADGYDTTADVALNAALCCVKHRSELPLQGGVTTPSVAFGDVMLDNYSDHIKAEVLKSNL